MLCWSLKPLRLADWGCQLVQHQQGVVHMVLPTGWFKKQRVCTCNIQVFLSYNNFLTLSGKEQLQES